MSQIITLRKAILPGAYLVAVTLVWSAFGLPVPARSSEKGAALHRGETLQGVMLASGESWQDYKRIKQRKTGKRRKSANTTKGMSTLDAKRRSRNLAVPNPKLIRAPATATDQGAGWRFYHGTMNIDSNAYYDPHSVNFPWAYSRREPLPNHPRIVVSMPNAEEGEGVLDSFVPSILGDIEVRSLDAGVYQAAWLEWWMFGRNGTPYPGRRIAATLQFLSSHYWLDLSVNGIVLTGRSMGGTGAVFQTMILPAPWREYIAYSTGRGGILLPRPIALDKHSSFVKFPPAEAGQSPLWDSVDFEIQATTDRVVRGIHYRHVMSSDDPSSIGPQNQHFQLQFVNVIEQQKMGGAFTWVKGGSGVVEEGVNLPDLSRFETPEQNVTLDRVHPAITQSTGNYPLSAEDRAQQSRFPRGHYNMGITWDHTNIVDERGQIVLPLKYQKRVNLGGGIPDQPTIITVNVTPRRARNFQLQDGAVLKWSYNNAEISGTARVVGDTVTVEGIPLASGEAYKSLRIYR